MPVEGTWDPRFAGVAGALRDDGAAVCVIAGGRTVVDAWAGEGWTRDTAVNVFSAAKPLAAVLVLRAGVALGTPVAELWPSFAAPATVHHALTHQAGVPALAAPLGPEVAYDWEAMCGALAAQEPWWEPGTAHGYHVNTYGFLLGEIARRATGRSPRELLREAIGDAELWYGAPPGRPVADFEFTAGTIGGAGGGTFGALQHAAYFNPPGISGLGTVNSAEWRAAVIPSTNAHATARGLARVYAGLLAGTVLEPALLPLATAEHVNGPDLVLGRDQRFGLGFQLPLPERPLGRSAAAFGHYGVGGALAFADPEADVAFAYTPSRGGPRWQDPRSRALVDALYAAL